MPAINPGISVSRVGGAAQIKALKKADGVEEIFLPGERSGRKAEENAANGIEVPQPVYEELLELGKPYGLSL